MQWEVCVMKNKERIESVRQKEQKTEMVRLREIEKQITQRRPNATKSSNEKEAR
jgi:hypothetical protein